VTRGTTFKKYLTTFIDSSRTRSDGRRLLGIDGASNLEGGTDCEERKEQQDGTCRSMST
jgi:hypothetical protein